MLRTNPRSPRPVSTNDGLCPLKLACKSRGWVGGGGVDEETVERAGGQQRIVGMQEEEK